MSPAMVVLLLAPISIFIHGLSSLFFYQFMHLRAWDKKLNEEWAVPLNGFEDVCEVNFPLICITICILG